MISSFVAALALQAGVAATQAATPLTTSFQLRAPAEVIATITARCDTCAWHVEGREAVTLRVALDGRYVAHLPLVRYGVAEYQVLIGSAAAGRHSVSVQVDSKLSATELREKGAARIERVHITSIARDHADYTPASLAPVLYARPNAVGRFTDVPVFMWYEREPTSRGTRYRYSVVFTNEDGGTPADRLMATWGRTTDIEYVYGVEVDENGKIIADDYQGPDHQIVPFRGKRDGRHPLLWVSTDNNMVRDAGTTDVRYAPAPVPFRLDGVSREAVMDTHPWLYEVAAQELVREGKIVDDAPPGRGAIPDPRRFVYVEACGEVGGAALGFEIQAGSRWVPSDRGMAAYRIVRDGCFRAAIPLPAPLGRSDLHALRVVASARPEKPGTAAAPAPGPIRLDRINTVFMFEVGHRPGPALLRWTGPASIDVGKPLEIPITSP